MKKPGNRPGSIGLPGDTLDRRWLGFLLHHKNPFHPSEVMGRKATHKNILSRLSGCLKGNLVALLGPEELGVRDNIAGHGAWNVIAGCCGHGRIRKGFFIRSLCQEHKIVTHDRLGQGTGIRHDNFNFLAGFGFDPANVELHGVIGGNFHRKN